MLGWLASFALLASIAAWAWRTRPAAGRLTHISITSTLLASPIAWFGYACLLVPQLLDLEGRNAADSVAAKP